MSLALVPFSLSWGFVPRLGPVESGAVALAVVSTSLAFGNAITNVSLNADAESQGGAFGLTQSASSLARTGGPGLAGLLYVVVAYWSPFVVAGILFLPILGLFGRVVHDDVRPAVD